MSHSPVGSASPMPATSKDSNVSTARADAPAADVAVIVVSYNTASLIDPCFARLKPALEGLSSQVFAVDNASRDGSVAALEAHRDECTVVANPTNVGFGRGNNQVLPAVKSRYVLLLNLDASIEPDAIRKTVAYMDANPRCGVLGVRLVGPDGRLQPSCRYFPTPWNGFLVRTGADRWFPRTRLVDDLSWDHASPRECDWVPGCFYLVRKEVIDSVGLFDPRFFLYCEEVDHCRRVKAAGWSVVFNPCTTVVHIGGESAKTDSALSGGRQISALQAESEWLYFRKHHGLAGVMVELSLAAVADALAVVKAILKRRSLRELDDGSVRLRAIWPAFHRTSGGRIPAR